jgi:hypothetical protein
MKVGDAVREVTKMNRKPSAGVILKTQPCRAANCGCNSKEYLVYFFDDGDRCWMGPRFLEAI